MALTQLKSKRKPTGGRYKSGRKEKLHTTGRPATMTKIGETRIKTIKGLGANKKTVVLQSDFVNVMDPKTKNYVKAKIKTVVESPANRHYIRRNIMNKGAVVETDKGNVRITSRPGQDGTLNGVLV